MEAEKVIEQQIREFTRLGEDKKFSQHQNTPKMLGMRL
jgi:hypothetical protein